MKNFCLICIVFLITGCANIHPVVMEKDRVEINSVAAILGKTLTRNLGDPMVVEEKVVFIYTLVATRDFQPPAQFGAPPYPEIKAGLILTPYGRLDNGDILYTNKTLRLEKNRLQYCIAVNTRNEAYGDAACAAGLVRKWDADTADLLESRRVYRTGSFKRELVYNGRSRDTIKLIYREFDHNMIRPAFTQELDYDLSASKEIGFKGMRLEILDANNSFIKFIVLSPMSTPLTTDRPPDNPVKPQPGWGVKQSLPL